MVLSYSIDADDRIIGTSDTWDAFAMQNCGAGARTNLVSGHRIWSFVSGDQTQSFLNAIFFSVRRTQQPFSTKTRCDSSETKRSCTMYVVPSGGMGLKISFKMMQTHAVKKLSKRCTLTSRSYRVCSICNALELDGNWNHENTTALSSSTGSNFGVCPSCRKVTRDKINRLSRQSAFAAN